MNMINTPSARPCDPRYNPYVERNKMKDMSGLTFEENKVLTEVKDLIASLGDSAVKVQVLEPEEQWNGMHISVTGFMSTGVAGTGDFALGLDVLQKMAKDEDYKREMLRQMQDQVEMERKNQTGLATVGLVPPQKPLEVPPLPMDFWNEDENDTKSVFRTLYAQAKQAQAFANKYEENFLYE